ncbi:DUF1871 domain-containing protein [Bacillus sp. M6-12]|uniref:DUF1871 family protein n=1 Tax=Bacillus sp. M6-12 TaxID=2054166 RepID=UPI000C7610B0|nr:DUF1871 family protein [Bacillus sp. M6-12]PLS15697.1 DUF1871 domain-containing protein [Bacillus sp. M6-12]
MQIQDVHREMKIALQNWDPFGWGEEAYDTEIADVIMAVHDFNEPGKLAEEIQRIYEFSFEQMIELQACLKIATELLVIKNRASCSF